MITQTEYKRTRRKHQAQFCYVIFMCALLIGVFAIWLIQVLFFPEGFLASFASNIREVAIGILIISIIGAIGVTVWAVSASLAKMANYKEEAAIYFNAVEHKNHAYVMSKMIQPPSDTEDIIYHVTFDFFDGQRKSFTVDASQYNSLMEKEAGVLVYKQNGTHLFFGDFHPKRQ